jgi:hypothetical protein
MRFKLYRPKGNSDVQLLMTQDAYQAFLDLEGYRHVHGPVINDTVHGQQLRMAFGTFTFTSAAAMLLPDASARHYGTYETLDYFVELCDVIRIDQNVPVPFCGDPEDHQTDFLNGYGVKPGLFQVFLETVRRKHFEELGIVRTDDAR